MRRSATPATSPRGAPAVLLSRDGTSDLSIAGSSWGMWGSGGDDEYHLAQLRVDGVFVDIGAHIGTVTLAVLADNPAATAICVEPLAENCEVIVDTMEANGFAERVTVLQAAIGPGDDVVIHYGYSGSAYLDNHRFVGGIDGGKDAHAAVTVPTVTLARLVAWADGAIDALKLDCEGCEWLALADPAVADCRVIFGEWHGDKGGGFPAIADLLERTHELEVLADLGGTGIFRATRR